MGKDIWEKDISKYFNIDKYSDEKHIISEICDSEEEFQELLQHVVWS